MPISLPSHDAVAAFLWGLCKSLVPLPSPSGFIIMAAEIARPVADARDIVARLVTRLVLPGAAGVVLGGFPYYLWVRRGGRKAVARWGSRLGISMRRIDKFERGGGWRRGALVFSLFALPLSPTLLAAVVAGLFEVGPGSFAALAFAGAAVRCAALAGLGWAFRSHFGDPVSFVRPWEGAAVLIAAVAGAGWIVRRRFSAAETSDSIFESGAVMRAERSGSSDAA